jgi:hypothetical protein
MEGTAMIRSAVMTFMAGAAALRLLASVVIFVAAPTRWWPLSSEAVHLSPHCPIAGFNL